MPNLTRPALLAAALTAATALTIAPANAAGSLTWHVSATATAGDCLIRAAATTTGHGFDGEVTARNGETAASEPVNIPASGGKQVVKLHVPSGSYTVQLTTRNGFLKRQTAVDCSAGLIRRGLA